jgi:hypothetical protein
LASATRCLRVRVSSVIRASTSPIRCAIRSVTWGMDVQFTSPTTAKNWTTDHPGSFVTELPPRSVDETAVDKDDVCHDLLLRFLRLFSFGWMRHKPMVGRIAWEAMSGPMLEWGASGPLSAPMSLKAFLDGASRLLQPAPQRLGLRLGQREVNVAQNGDERWSKACGGDWTVPPSTLIERSQTARDCRIALGTPALGDCPIRAGAGPPARHPTDPVVRSGPTALFGQQFWDTSASSITVCFSLERCSRYLGWSVSTRCPTLCPGGRVPRGLWCRQGLPQAGRNGVSSRSPSHAQMLKNSGLGRPWGVRWSVGAATSIMAA